MSQPMVSGVCSPATTTPSSRMDLLPPNFATSQHLSQHQMNRPQQQEYRQSHNHHAFNKNTTSRLQGPTNTNNGLMTSVSLASTSPPSSSSSNTSSPKTSSSSSGFTSASQLSSDAGSRMPSRLISSNGSSTLSAPGIATTHVGSHGTNGVLSKSSDKSSSPSLDADRDSTSKGMLAADLRANEVAVTSQPPPSSVPAYTKTTQASSALASSTPPTAKLSKQESTPANVTPDGSDNQIPTIAQRDALTSRVYSVCRSAGYSNWLHLLELAPLASQHHLSGYNCMKFGKQGSPYAYFPLTLQQPWQADAVTEKQRVSEDEAVKWLIQKRRKKGKMQDADRGVKRGGGVLEDDGSRARGIPHDEDVHSTIEGGQVKVAKAGKDIDHDDDCEMREASPSRQTKKTSKCDADDEVEVSGPLKDVIAVSQEFEEPIKKGEDCQDLKSNCDKGESTSKEASIQDNTGVHHDANSAAIKTSDSHPISISPMIPAELMIDVTKYVQMGLSGGGCKDVDTNAIYEETNTSRHCELQIQGKRLIRCQTSRIDLWEIAQKAEREIIEASQAKRATRMLTMEPDHVRHPSSWLQTVYSDKETPENGDSDLIPLAFGGRYRGFTIGNLLLSSCPGKKVRLTGPVRGRGAICRNLGLDLKRIKHLGVGALVCCLDDEELAFLGAPWSEYEKEADQLGMEVVRLPMAEGFSPTDVATTDNALTSIVEHFTLRGVNVLVHCRGGVGRAGLIACIWMLKLGLVRSDHDEEIFASKSEVAMHLEGGLPDTSGDSLDEDVPIGNNNDSAAASAVAPRDVDQREETMQIVHRLIDTIRRRRSPKAIETAEQVSFLYKYVMYLHEQESQRTVQQR